MTGGPFRAAVVLSLWASLAACSAPASDPSSVPGAANRPSSLVTSASSGTLQAPDVAWSVAVPAEFQSGRTAQVLGRWFILTAQERLVGPADDRTSRVRILTGDLRTGRTDLAWAIDDAASVPYAFVTDGGPRALLNRRDVDSGELRLSLVDPRDGSLVWSRGLPLAENGEVGRGAQFHVAGVASGLIVGQVLGSSPQQQACAVCALDAESGRIVWAVPGMVSKAGTASSSISVGEGMVATHLGEPDRGEFLLLDARDGTVLRRSRSSWAVLFLQSPFLMTPDGVLVLEAPDPVAGTRRAVAVDRGGATAWVATVRTDAVVSTADGTVVLPMADGRYEARTLLSQGALWEIPPPSPGEEPFALTAGVGDLLIGVSGDRALVLEGSSGRALHSGHFYAPFPSRWGAGTYLAWDGDRRLTAYRGPRMPVGVELGPRGEVPVFVRR